MQIGEVARSTGLSVDTIRFYEKQALLARLARSASGYRVYAEGDVERLRSIGRAQMLGFSLGEIRELLLIESSEAGGCSHVQELIAAKMLQVKEKIEELHRIEMRLRRAHQQCGAALRNACHAACPVLEQMELLREKEPGG